MHHQDTGEQVPNYGPLHQAVSYLAGVCDGALRRDDCGFNAADTHAGHALAFVPAAAWTPQMARHAYETLRTYRVQLMRGWGIDYGALPEPGAAPGEMTRSITCAQTHSGFVVMAPYSTGIGWALRGAIECSWFIREPVAHFEVAPVRGVGARLLTWAAKHEMPLGHGVAERCAFVDEHAAHVVCEGDGFAVLALKDRGLNPLLRSIPALFSAKDPYFRWKVPYRPDSAHVLIRLMGEQNLVCDAAALARLEELEAAFLAAGLPILPERRVQLAPGGGFLVAFPYSPEEVTRFKASFAGGDSVVLPGVKWNPKDRWWEVGESMDLIGKMRSFLKSVQTTAQGYVVAEGVHTRLDELATSLTTRAQRSRAATAELVVPGLRREPYPFQKAGIQYAADAGRTLIGDEPGLGKTLQAIGTIQMLNAYPCVIVVPASIKINWLREWQMSVPEKRVTILTGVKSASLAPTDVVIVNYDILHAWTEPLQAIFPQAVVYDESHLIKEPKSRRSKAAKTLASGVRVRLCLTGTPVLNRPRELLHQIDVLGRLDTFGGAHKFLRRYCLGGGGYGGRAAYDGAQHLDELNRKMREQFYVRRTKAEVLKDLPAKRRARVILPLENRREYERARADVIAYLLAEKGKAAAIRASQAETLVRIEMLKQLCVKGKLDAAIEWVADFIDSGAKLVLFTIHREQQAALLGKFPGAAHIYAEDTLAVRQQNVDRFQTDPACTLILCSLKAGGVGITLTAASDVAFLELGWTPGEMSQGEDRVHRIGQDESVTAWYLLADQTIDQDIEALLEEKLLVATAATDGGSSARSSSIISDLIKGMIE